MARKVKKIHTNGGNDYISANYIHYIVGEKAPFSRWMGRRIAQFDLENERDYLVVERELIGVVRRKTDRDFGDVYLSFDAAKLLIMVQKNEKGKESIKYIAKNSIISIYDLYSVIADIDIKDKDYKLYAVVDESGRYKVGISSEPERRVRELNIGNAEKLTLVHVADTELPKFGDEVRAHKELIGYKIRSEWFRCGDKLNSIFINNN